MSENIQLVLFLLREMLILAVMAAPLALIPAYLARKKGRSFTLWFLYGLFAFFYAFVCFDVWWYTGRDMFGVLLLGIALAILPLAHAWFALPAAVATPQDHDLMFGKMVTSNAQTVGDDRAIYFYDTMGIWITLAFLIIAITGVVVANARLGDTGENVTLVAAPPPPPAAAPPAPPPKVTKPVEVPQFASVKEAPKEIKTVVEKRPPVPVQTFEAAPGGVPGGVPGGIPGGAVTDAPPPPPPPVEKKEEPKPEPPKIIRKSGGVLQGSATRRVEPAYPALAKTARVSGSVVVEVTVDEAGNVMSARAISGHPLLKTAAEQAARGWKFTPTQLSGVPVKVIGTITFNFNL